MSKSAARGTGFALLFVLAGAQSLRAQSTIRLGHEFQVNTYTTNIQILPRMAATANGDFVMVWDSGLQDGAGGSIFARRWTSAGAPIGGELQVNTYTNSNQDYPAVALDAAGNFVVVWDSVVQDNPSGGGGIFAQRFDAAGTRLATEFQVNVATTWSQNRPVVVMNASGQFVIAWDSNIQDGYGYGIFGRRFAAGGAAIGGEFLINTYTAKTEANPSVAMDGDGAFVVVWISDHDGGGYGIFGQRYASSGAAIAVEFQVNQHSIGDQLRPAVAAGPGGDFVAAWQGYGDGYSPGIFAQRFDSAGARQAVEFQVNTEILYAQQRPSLAVGPRGDFVVAWESEFLDGGGSFGMFARHFDSAGTPQAAEFQVNSYTPGNQYYSSMTASGQHGFVISWTSIGQDGSFGGIFAQRVATLAILDIDGNGAIGALTDGLLVLRFMFGFTGPTLITGAVDVVGCTRCDASSIAGYLQTLI
jgi:hypothetical protein